MATRTHRSAKTDNNPRWDDHEKWTTEQFRDAYRAAMNYYRMESPEKDPKARVIDWMGRNGYDRETIQNFHDTASWRCSNTMFAIAMCLMRGMPAVRKDFNNGKNTEHWLRESIARVIADGANDIAPTPKAARIAAPVQVNIQDRIRDQAVDISNDIDIAIDNWIRDPDSFDPKAYKITSLLRGKGCKAAQARHIRGFYERELQDLKELASGNGHEQLREAYGHVARKNIKKLIEFLEAIESACEQIAAETRVLKKPRKKKAKPAEELVKKLRFRISDDKLGVSSVPPAGIIGSQLVVVYNTKTRKLGTYISKTSEGLSVKGSGITGFTDLSFQKTLRKPEVQIKEIRALTTQRRVEEYFAKSVKTTETKLTGRINADVLIVKVFK